ncbi:MAG: C4-dicarboxylate ABC transporter substrate-binding protein [Betaproteobacteria bacterium]|nr:C4-dicarboxylate ABC transporter substrate-binding protein [Betaproteobacteria bacterium]
MIAHLRARLVSLRDLLATAWPIVLIVAAGLIVAYQFVEPAPPKQFRIAASAADGTYYAFAQRYAKILAKNQITLEIVPTSGSRQNLKLLKSGAVDVAFVQGGTTLPRQTAGTDKTAEDEDDEDVAQSFAGLRSLGSVYYEPVWLFYRDPYAESSGAAREKPQNPQRTDERHRPIERLSQLGGKRIAIGARGSGIRSLAVRLLRANEIETYNSSLNNASSNEAAQALEQGKLDAAFVIAAPEAPIVQSLLHSPGVLIMNFTQAEAYTRRFPFLFKVVLPRGAVDLVRDAPPRDTMLLATTANLVANENLHPALASLLLEAAAKVHGNPGFFQNANEFPAYLDRSIELAPEAERYYKSGPPFLQRYLPFWAALLIERTIIMLLPLIALLLPLLRIAPMIYSWRIRARVFRCYGELKFLENELHEHYNPAQRQSYLDRLDRLEDEANHRRVPLAFVNLVYTLREHIHLVRKQILRREKEPEEQDGGEKNP